MKKTEAIKRMNDLGNKKTPFFFMIDFDMKHCFVQAIESIDANEIRFNFNGIKNHATGTSEIKKNLIFKKTPIPFEM